MAIIYIYMWISLINDDWFISSGMIPAWVYWGCNCGESTENRFANYRWGIPGIVSGETNSSYTWYLVRLGGAGPAFSSLA